MKWLVTIWFSPDPNDFIEVRVNPADNAEEAIELTNRILEVLELDSQFHDMSAVID